MIPIASATNAIAKGISQFAAVPVGFLANNGNNALDVAGKSSLFMVDLISRGGAVPEAIPEVILDLTRARLRLEGIHSYGVVTALLMNASLRLFSATPRRMQAGDTYTNLSKAVFAFAICISVMTGSYTTIIFSMLGLYSKTALGMGDDAKFLHFFAETSQLRKSGFDAFVLSTITFKIAFVLSLFLNYDGKFRWILGLFAVACTMTFWFKYFSMIQIAGEILFSV